MKEDILSLVHEKVDKGNRGMTGKDMEDIGTDIDYFWRAQQITTTTVFSAENHLYNSHCTGTS